MNGSCKECESTGVMCEMCAAAAAGAQPKNVPIRVYGGYLEARAALRANAPAVAVRVLEWLLGYLAEQRGVAPDRSLPVKVESLQRQNVIRSQPELVETALSPGASPEKAWALLSLTENAFNRLYLR